MSADEEPPRTACTVRVFGRVQGVAFRWHARERARSLGVMGRVRNLRDGSVEVHAEGRASQVDELVEWLRRGPALARVERLERAPAQPEGSQSFEISA